MTETPTPTPQVGQEAAPSPFSVPLGTGGDDRRAYFRDVPKEMIAQYVLQFVNSKNNEGDMLATVVLRRNPVVSVDLFIMHLRNTKTGKQYIIATDTNGAFFDPFNRIALTYYDEFVAYTPNGIALTKEEFVADGAVLLEDNPADPPGVYVDPDRRFPDSEPTGKEAEIAKIAEAFKLATASAAPTPPAETPTPTLAPEVPPAPPAPKKAPAKTPKPPAK